jgi:hypothetical protein
MPDDGVAEFVRRLTGPVAGAGATDRELLARFLDHRDEAAFEALVRRHHRLVRSAAARVLIDPNDADSVQAAFLVLVRRARRGDWRAELRPCGVLCQNRPDRLPQSRKVEKSALTSGA